MREDRPDGEFRESSSLPLNPRRRRLSASGRRATTGALRRSAFQKYALILAWLVVVIVFSLLKPDTYATSGNFQTIFGSQAVLLILALGLIVPLTSGDFDLSIAAVLSLASMVLAILQVRHGWSLFPAIVVVLAIGLFIGLINGALVTLLEIDSFIVTLGSATVDPGRRALDQRLEHRSAASATASSTGRSPTGSSGSRWCSGTASC